MNDDAHLTHGLAGDELPPDWPPLTLTEVEGLLARFPRLGGVVAVRWRSPRPLSAAALVATSIGEVFIKRHHRSVRSAVMLAEEHRFASHLRERGIAVPEVLDDVDGESAIAIDAWVYEVHRPAVGTDVYRNAFSWSPIGGVAHARAAGAMLARLHRAARDYRAPQRSTHILVARAEVLSSADPLEAIEASLRSRPSLGSYLRDRDWRTEIGEAMAPWHERAVGGIARQPRSWTHGDWHVSNLCWSDAGDEARITDVLDFGLSALTFGLFDLATAIERNAIAWLDIAQGDIGRTDLALALLEGYHEVSPLTADDLSLLADLLPIVHLDFALSEIEYFEGVTRRRDHADVAYQTFLRGHAAWFAGPHGQALLDAIRDAGAPIVVQ
ncbi:aminoglycoside phosphotransferase [Luteibacter rhizovicinus DSM 16549]|uniref:Aminoglycoside phosphotransferase n=1 Tax=Luteibacter rhizovicinus DSM 16549 TaxID=1440763 RepID=A0A0G9HGM5_9GAMM|nr:phosphotransferase [Luteibacter rhizovicinus]APG03278.1 aminoglycoside phosphotransferase [Luteibacter rhizovicinus DSM 16549]KLD68324.1 aminoglycoside phosphotransferase [Luteibacter rhizovicinus DSM 16549]KLD76523.1 aminoglycoside phosphotransferase [Xanthomonas hyacinthi DSM 19077]